MSVAYPQHRESTKNSGLSVAGMVMGILALILCFVPPVILLVGGMSLIGLALSIIALATASDNGHRTDYAIAGTITNGASFVVFILAMISVATGIVQ